LKVDAKRLVAHARFVAQAEAQKQSPATTLATDAFRGVTELTVMAPDHPHLLSIIAGACAAAGANIVDAQIFTTTDGFALDTIFISRAFEQDEDELRRAERVTGMIQKALLGELHVGRTLAGKVRPHPAAKAFDVPAEVVIDNSLSNRFTVVEVSGLDRQGLLYDLTRALSKLNLNIGSAHIATFGEKAVDAFYVTDLTGAKIVNTNRQAAIRRHLIEVLGGEDASAMR
jgi:[protein-PII] uridylyltransferase